MRTSALILFFLLASFLPGILSPGAKAGTPAVSDTRQAAQSFSISPDFSDLFATQTVQPAVPNPMRALRKQQDRPQRTGSEAPDAYAVQHFTPSDNGRGRWIASRIMPNGPSDGPAHCAVYLRFGVLVI